MVEKLKKEIKNVNLEPNKTHIKIWYSFSDAENCRYEYDCSIKKGGKRGMPEEN